MDSTHRKEWENLDYDYHGIVMDELTPRVEGEKLEDGWDLAVLDDSV
jgi:hypothetical protein